jgi:hypothetical protein
MPAVLAEEDCCPAGESSETRANNVENAMNVTTGNNNR